MVQVNGDSDSRPSTPSTTAAPKQKTDYPTGSNGANLWEPGFFKRLPQLAVLAIFGVFVCLMLSLLVVILSDGRPIASWKVKPSVLLAFSSAIANTLLAYGLSTGISITWWRNALTQSTLAELHKDWSHSRSFFGAFASGRFKSPLVLASILSTLAILDGPLLQKSIAVSTQESQIKNNTFISIATSTSPGYFTMQNGGPSFPSSDFRQIFTDIEVASSIYFNNLGCDNCGGFVWGIGIYPICQTRNISTSAMASDNRTNIFQIDFDWAPSLTNRSHNGLGEFTGITMNLTFTYLNGAWYGPSLGASADMYDSGPEACQPTPESMISVEKSCELVTAPYLYDFGILKNEVSVNNPKSSYDITYRYAIPESTIWNITKSQDFHGRRRKDFSNSTWRGLYHALNEKFASSITLPNQPNISVESFDDRMADIKLQGWFANNAVYFKQIPDLKGGGLKNCAIGALDPINSVMRWVSNVLFRVSISVDEEYRDSQAVDITWSFPRETYVVNYRFLAGGLVLMFVAGLAVARTLWGWWDLGREVTMSPLETASALNAPLLVAESSGSTIRDIVRDFGNIKVAYGETQHEGGAQGHRRLAISHVESVRKPGSGVNG